VRAVTGFENELLRQSVRHLEHELERLQATWWWRVGSLLRLVPPSEEQHVQRRARDGGRAR
jgi:hypothetical protein